MTHEQAEKIRDRAEKLKFKDLQKLNPTLRDMYYFGEVLQLGYGRGLVGGFSNDGIGEDTFEHVDKLMRKIGK